MLGTALLFNGIAMEICGSSCPASGSEHLISHALDAISKRPRLHGLQVGVATYLVSRVQKNQSERIADLFDNVGFWSEIRSDPFSRLEWREALHLALTIKEDFYTILSEEGALVDGGLVRPVTAPKGSWAQTWPENSHRLWRARHPCPIDAPPPRPSPAGGCVWNNGCTPLRP